METRYLISESCLFSSKPGKTTINWLIWEKKFVFETHALRNVRSCPPCSACHRSFNFESFSIPVLNLMNLIPSVRKFFHPVSHSASLWMGALLIQSFLFHKQAHHFSVENHHLTNGSCKDSLPADSYPKTKITMVQAKKIENSLS